jgi:hypothetical protein
MPAPIIVAQTPKTQEPASILLIRIIKSSLPRIAKPAFRPENQRWKRGVVSLPSA